MLVFNLTDQVRETIQHTLYRLLGRRRNAFRLGPFAAARRRDRRVRARYRQRRSARRHRARHRSGTEQRRARAMRVARRPVRKSRIGQPRARAMSRRSRSGFTATAVPTADSIGTSFTESE